ncbi:hypothetical protein ABW20_dc0104818 [Dactylellina cionopaga]|nr:hypothetical protein ABW20_dc0104818 [Dactylellina cionopaga]
MPTSKGRTVYQFQADANLLYLRSRLWLHVLPLNPIVLLAHPQPVSEHPAYYPSCTSRPRVAESGSQNGKLNIAEDLPTRAKLVFGSRLVGPQRRTDTKHQAQLIGGIRVPPKPQEPDNCCMSGCVNCVWDIFREDLEDWAIATAKAEKALHKHHDVRLPSALSKAGSGIASKPEIVDDRDEADRAAIGATMWKGLEDIPIGIRVFMDTEKAIRSRRAIEHEAGGS